MAFRMRKKDQRAAARARAMKNPCKSLKAGTLNPPFYESQEWLSLRYFTLKRYGAVCMLCGASRTEMHVDHIKPRSKFPELALDPENLQVLCRACNMGKKNADDTDFRPR